MAAVVDAYIRAMGLARATRFIETLRKELAALAAERHDLARRYVEAIRSWDAAEIERLLEACKVYLQDRVWIGNFRINAVTGTCHLGNGEKSARLFSSSSSGQSAL